MPVKPESTEKKIARLKKLIDEAQRILRELPPPSDPPHPITVTNKAVKIRKR